MGLSAFVIQLVFNGIIIGSVYALIALGFVVIYKATHILNFAQGELLMIGGYLCFVFIVDIGLPYLPAFLLTMISMALFATSLELTLFRKMNGEPVFSLIMITVGLSSLIRSVAAFLWGDMDFTELPSPFSGQSLTILNANVTWAQLGAVLAMITVFMLINYFYRSTRIGTAMRSACEDQDAATLTGVNVTRVFQLAWVIAAVVAATGGIFFAQINYLHPSMGFVAVRVFPAIILGGLESISGAIVGGLIIGLAENLVGGLVGHGLQEVTAYIILLVVLLLRPYGLFGIKEIERI